MISFISSIIFSLIDSLFFLIGEDYVQKTLLTIPFIDQNMAELDTNGRQCPATDNGVIFFHPSFFLNGRPCST